MAEPGIVACAMLASTEDSVRKQIVTFIRNNRQKKYVKPKKKVLQGIREFKIPQLEWKANHWTEIITWDMTYFYEPQIIKDISDADLDSVTDTPYSFPALPLHSTSVERAVRLVTQASAKVYGMKARHEYILSMIKSRKIRPTFENKKDYKCVA